MGTQYETVRIQVSGANTSPITVTVPVDTTSGSGSATFSYTGTNGGTDTLQGTATLAGTNYTSNSAQVNWQSSNGNIQLGDLVKAYGWGDSPTSGAVATYIWRNVIDTGATSAAPRSLNDAQATATNNSLCFDYQGGGVGPTLTNWTTLNAAGSGVSQVQFPPFGQNFNVIVTGYLLVPAPGNYTISITYKDGVIWGIGSSTTGAQPTWAGKGSVVGPKGQTMTVVGGYPLLSAPQNNGSSGGIGSSSTSVNFTQAGVYPIEVGWDYWYHSGRQMHVYSQSGELAPVTIISAPAASTPTGNLTITPAGGTTNLQVTGQPITLTVNVSGISYPTKSYCPVYEGVTGQLFLYNDPSASTFTFPTYSGHAVNKAAAATSVFSLSSSDNTAYQGLFSIGYDGTNFNLIYNGSTANPNSSSRVLSTGLIVKANDIAWFNNANNSFDLFSASGNNGGTAYSLEIDYMNKPSVASISPTVVSANGGNYTLSIALNKAFSPQQQGAKNTGNSITATCSITGAVSTSTPVAVIDSNGWLTGWNVPFTAPTATANQSLTVNFNVSGTLTYLSGTSFVTNNVTYISGVAGTISANGTSYVAPTAVSFAALPAGPAYDSSTTSVTLTATAFTAGGNDPLTVRFFTQYVGQSSQVVLGTGSLLTSSPATINGVSGYQQIYQFSFNPNVYLDASPGDYLGFTATDTISNLSCTYTTTSAYSSTPISGGGGGGSTGGGGGCPAVDMFLLDGLRVEDAKVGVEVEAILDYQEPGVTLPILDMGFSTEMCYRFETENGAAVVVSESTPVPTLETWEAILAGVDPKTLPQLANAVKAGMHVLTNIEGRMEFSMLVETSRIGLRRVARLYIGGKNFAAGEDSSRRIYTHNASLNNQQQQEVSVK